MIIRTFWVWHQAESTPECSAARDQESVDVNPEGWERAKQEVRDTYGGSVHSGREIEVHLDIDVVLKHWWPDPVMGAVAVPGSHPTPKEDR